jgi:DNA-binding phage protein
LKMSVAMYLNDILEETFDNDHIRHTLKIVMIKWQQPLVLL